MSGVLDLLAIIVFVTIAAIFVTVPPLNETPMRALFGFVLIFFVPGYVFVSALFSEEELNELERIALSIGLSICVVIFIGLGLNYSPWGIRLDAILFSVSTFTLFFAIICSYMRVRRRKQPPDS